MKTMADHILDICQNSIRAKATLIEIMMEEEKNSDLYKIIIKDNGRGMDKQVQKQATDPFFTTRKTRKVGLGLALLKQNAELSGGSFQLKSEPGKGTVVEAVFGFSHIDRLPSGDMADTFLLLMNANKGNFILNYKTGKGAYNISSSEINDSVGEGMCKHKEIRKAILQLINNNLEEIEASIN